MQMPGASLAEVAKTAKSKPHTVRYVIQQLLDSNTLDPFYLIRFSKLGVRLYSFFFSVSPVKADLFIKQLQKDPRVTWITEQTGNPRFEMAVITRDPLEVDLLLKQLAEKTGAQIQERSWAIETDSYHFGSRYLGDIGRGILWEDHFSTPLTSLPLSELDLIIIDCLRDSSTLKRESFSELARRLKYPQTTVNYHIKKLIESGVLSKKMHYLSMEKAGLFQYQIVIVLNAEIPDIHEKLIEFCRKNPAVIYLTRGFGGWDYKIICQGMAFNDGLDVRDKLEYAFAGRFAQVSLMTRRRILAAATKLSKHPEIAAD